MLSWQEVKALPDIPSFKYCSDLIHHSGFQNHSQPSSGSGGAYPGSHTLQVNVGNATYNYHIYIPSGYQPSQAWPLLMVLHGAASPGQTNQAAISMRNFWQNTAELNQMILVAPVATGSQSWVMTEPSRTMWNQILSSMQGLYNVENARVYGWGFSAGGHVGHWYFLENSMRFAAYGVNAGVLEAYAGLNDPHFAARHIPVIEMVGTNDSLYPYTLNDQTAFLNAGWQAGVDYQLVTFNGGHVLNADAPAVIADFLCERSLYD